LGNKELAPQDKKLSGFQERIIQPEVPENRITLDNHFSLEMSMVIHENGKYDTCPCPIG